MGIDSCLVFATGSFKPVLSGEIQFITVNVPHEDTMLDRSIKENKVHLQSFNCVGKKIDNQQSQDSEFSDCVTWETVSVSVCVCVCVCVCVSHSVMSDSLWPHGLWPARLLCPWDSPGKNTGVGCHALLQGIFPTQGSNLGLCHCRKILYHLSYLGSP